MKRKSLILYLALLLPVLLLWGMTVSIGPAQARVEGTINQVTTVLRPLPGAVGSDLLIPAENQTIVLGSLGAGETVTAEFTLEATAAVYGPLDCVVLDEGELPILAQVQESEGLIAEGQMQMDAGTQSVVTLTITAPETIPAARTARVRVDFMGLTGIFLVDLEQDPPVEEPDLEETEPEQPDVPDDTESAAPEETEGEDPTEPTETAPAEEPAQPEPVELTLSTLNEFEISNCLPLKLTVSGTPEMVCIGLNGEETLPEWTRYSLDGGQNWYLLYFGGYLENPNTDQILLDFSRTALAEEEILVLEARAYTQSVCVGEATEDTVALAPGAQSGLVPILTGPDPEDLEILNGFLNPEEVPAAPDGEDSAQAQTEQSEPADEGASELAPEADGEPEFAWNTEHWFSIPLPAGWEQCGEAVSYSAELLQRSGEDAIAYAPVSWDSASLNGVIHPESGNLIVYLGGTTAAAGTYRLTLECVFEGICFYREQTTFFINYSTCSDWQNEEVPDYE